MWPNPQETVDLVKFTEEILKGKLHFLSRDKWMALNPFNVTGLFLYPLKILENQRFSDIFKGFGRSVEWNGVNILRFLFIFLCPEPGVLKNFDNFTEKHLCWNLILIKRNSNTNFFLWNLQNSKEHLFWRTFANECFSLSQ